MKNPAPWNTLILKVPGGPTLALTAPPSDEAVMAILTHGNATVVMDIDPASFDSALLRQFQVQILSDPRDMLEILNSPLPTTMMGRDAYEAVVEHGTQLVHQVIRVFQQDQDTVHADLLDEFRDALRIVGILDPENFDLQPYVDQLNNAPNLVAALNMLLTTALEREKVDIDATTRQALRGTEKRQLDATYLWQVCEKPEVQIYKLKEVGRKRRKNIMDMLKDVHPDLTLGMDLQPYRRWLKQP